MRCLPVRLQPGVDLRRAVEALGRQHFPEGGFVACGIGSLIDPRLRLAGDEGLTPYVGAFEILTLSGSVTPDGAHLHISIAAASGQVFGGHVPYGNEVRTTVKLLVLAPSGWALRRELDPLTGFAELAVQPIDRGGVV